MDQFDWNEDMRLLDDKKVPQVSQFEEMTSRRGVKYGYDNSIQLYAGSLCSGSYQCDIITTTVNPWNSGSTPGIFEFLDFSLRKIFR